MRSARSGGFSQTAGVQGFGLPKCQINYELMFKKDLGKFAVMYIVKSINKLCQVYLVENIRWSFNPPFRSTVPPLV